MLCSQITPLWLVCAGLERHTRLDGHSREQWRVQRDLRERAALADASGPRADASGPLADASGPLAGGGTRAV
jgi:hypothetical protein